MYFHPLPESMAYRPTTGPMMTIRKTKPSLMVIPICRNRLGISSGIEHIALQRLDIAGSRYGGRSCTYIWQKPPPQPAIASPAVNCAGDFAVAAINIPTAAITSPYSLGRVSIAFDIGIVLSGTALQEQTSSEQVAIGSGNQKPQRRACGVRRNVPIRRDAGRVSQLESEFRLHRSCGWHWPSCIAY